MTRSSIEVAVRSGHKKQSRDQTQCESVCAAARNRKAATSVTAFYLMSNDLTTLPGNPNIVKGDPRFVDPTHGDYHLLATRLGSDLEASPAIDFALPGVNAPNWLDIDGNPREQDVPSIFNLFGSRDFGAYEMQPIVDRIFADSFGDPISLVY